MIPQKMIPVECSVLIVNYNGGPLLTECVRSALASSVPVEILVWDNASRDDSIALLEEAFPGEPRLTVIRHPENLGFAGGVNRLIKMAGGRWLLLLNPDCLLAPDTIERVVEVMESDRKIGMAGCLILNPDGTEQAGCRRLIPTPWRSMVNVLRLDRLFADDPRFRNLSLCKDLLPEGPATVEAISGAFMLVRRAAVEDVGPLDHRYFLHCEDLDWCMRFGAKGWKIVFVPGAVAVHDKGECSNSRPVFVEWHKHKGMIRFYRKFFHEDYPGPLLAVVAMAVWTRFVARAVVGAFENLRLGSAESSIRRTALEKAERCLAVLERGEVFDVSGPRWPAPVNAGYESGREKLPDAPGALVTGATSQIGFFLLPLLRAEGTPYFALSREAVVSSFPGEHWIKGDLKRSNPFDGVGPVLTWFHLAELPLAVPWLDAAARAGVKRFVGFGSTSIFTKQHSSYRREQLFVKGLLKAESDIARIAGGNGISWTILRPTMIYGCGLDQNITFIQKVVGRFGFFPLVADGRGIRQPVHAEDLARFALLVSRSSLAQNKAYNLGGGEYLSFREMVERIFIDTGRSPRFVHLPFALIRLGINLIRLHPRYAYLSPAMFERMAVDLVTDNSEAFRDLGYSPRSFIVPR